MVGSRRRSRTSHEPNRRTCHSRPIVRLLLVFQSSGQAHKTFASYVTPPRRDAPRQVPEKDRLNIRSGTTSAIQHSQPGSYFPPSRLGCGRLRCHSLISFRNSLFFVSFVSVASCRSSSAIRPAAKSGRPDFFGFSNRIVMAPLSIVSHDDGFY